MVTGHSEKEHLHNLEAVLQRLKEAGIWLKQKKCAFLLPEVDYLGHRLSAEGLRPTMDKIRAIVETPAPRNVSQLRSLGVIDYYLPNLSSQLAPLYHLLQKGTKWEWTDAQEKAFQESKVPLATSPLLVHYDLDKELILSCDASPYGIGAVLSHVMEDGTERPIAFASRSLAAAEKNYVQLEREGLAIVFGVKKFHPYLFGRSFTILSDHQPLKHLFGESRATPSMASARIQRWALTLSAYKYTMAYKSGVQHANADVLSRLPLPESPAHVPSPGDTVLLMESLQTMPITSNGLAERAVQTFKEGLKKQSTGSIQARVSRFLFAYRITPHSSAGQFPAQLLLGRCPRSHLDVMHPQVDKRVHESQERQKANHDRCAKARTFMAGDKVYARNLTSGPAWLEGTVVIHSRTWWT